MSLSSAARRQQIIGAATKPKIRKKNTGMVRKGLYAIDEVLSHITDPDCLKERVEFEGDMVHVASVRLKCFKFNGLVCVTCGIVGEYFAKERSPCRSERVLYHFNLYGLDPEGDEVLMTKDHIRPRWLGGRDDLANLATMCKVCNEAKGGDYSVSETL